MTAPPRAPLVLHATAVARSGRGLLILGASGAGKSALALDLMSRGAQLVADDRTCLGRRGAALIAWSPPAILGRIEARNIGILAAEPAPPTPVALVVDLDRTPSDRLPESRRWTALGWCGTVVDGRDVPGLAPALIQYLRCGKAEEDDRAGE